MLNFISEIYFGIRNLNLGGFFFQGEEIGHARKKYLIVSISVPDLKHCINIDLNFLIYLAPRMAIPKLFDSLSQTRKKEYLKPSVL